MSVATHQLNLLVAFFFPVATLTAIFGVNLRHGLESWDRLSAPLPLEIVIAAGLLCGVMLTGFIARPARRPRRDTHGSPPNSRTNRSK